MIIEIKLKNKPFEIEVDGNCFTVNKLGTTEDGKPSTRPLGYYNKLSNAILRICREDVSNNPMKVTLQEYAKIIEENNKLLLEQLDLVQ